MYPMRNTMYGQISVGSFCNIESQVSVHKGEHILLIQLYIFTYKISTCIGKLDLSGVKPKEEGDKCGCISVTASDKRETRMIE